MRSSKGEPKLRVLAVNVYFHPASFGGATVIAEGLVQAMAEKADLAVFTSWQSLTAEPYEFVRYEAFGIPVFAVKIPALDPRRLEYKNDSMAEIFAQVLKVFAPDIVHMHSVQGLSASIAEACQLVGIPYVVTLHDAWWICERQFMIDKDQHYCNQQQLDLCVCAKCVPDFQYTLDRSRYLRSVLEQAALILTPSEFHRQLHLSNGFAADRIVVNRNGIKRPSPVERTSSSRVRFGFAGGNVSVKGFHLIQKAFAEISAANYQLVLVDNTLNLGISSMRWEAPSPAGQVEIVPAYRHDEIDGFFNRFDVLLFPSQWKESFGLTVREALMRDKWVIATAGGAATDDVVDGVNGTIIPMGNDHRPIVRAIEAILRNPSRLQNYENPLKHRIRVIEEQAEECYEYLARVVGETEILASSLSACRG